MKINNERFIKLEKRQLYKYILLLGIILGFLGILTLYYLFFSEILRTLFHIEGAWTILIVILIRIIVLLAMSFYMFHKWLNQESIYLSDIPFLFGLFFIILTFGKMLDILTNFTYYTLDTETFLIILKIRHFVIILTILPMLFLSIGMILYMRSLKEKRKNLRNEKYRDKLRLKILLLILISESIAVSLYPNTTIAGIVMAIIMMPSLLVITWMFFFAYKNKRLSQVQPLILAIGFGMYTISQITRPLIQYIIGETASYIIVSEIIDLTIFILIFTGLIIEANYRI